MRLVAVTVRNYRIHRETTVLFDPSRTVIGGPNEAGKSTIMEAVHRVLFLRSRATGAVLDSMRSEFHAGHPAVELTFESGGSTYTLSKQFTGSNSAPTTLAETGKPALRGEPAEEAIHRILKAESVGGGRGVEDRLRMQWAHLWVWQGAAGADPLDPAVGKPLDRLRERLGSLEAGDVLESPLDAAVAQAVRDVHASRTKDDGTPRAGAPLAGATVELRSAGEAHAAAQAAVATLHAAVTSVEAADATIAECETSLASTRVEQQETRDRAAESKRLAILEAEQRAAASGALAAHRGLEEGDLQIADCTRQIADIEARREPAAGSLAAAAAAEKAADERVDAAMSAAGDLQHRQAAIAALVELHARCEHLERRRAERSGLAGRCGRIAALRAEAASLRKQLDGLAAVTAEDLANLAVLERKRDGAQATLDAIATRIELVAAAGPVRLGDHDLAVGMAETITTAQELAVGGSMRLRISPGGGTTLTDATRRRDDAEIALAARLVELGITGTDDARRIQPLRQSLEADLKAKQTAINDLGGDKADDDLARLDEEIAGLDEALAGAPCPGFTKPDGLEPAIAARKAIDTAHHALVEKCSQANAELEAAVRLRAAARETLRQADEAIRTSDDELRTHESRLRVLVDKHGTERAARIDELRRASAAADAALASTRARLAELQPHLLERASQRLERAVEKILERKQEAQTTRTISLDRLRLEGSMDPRDDLARAAVRERLAASRHRQASREARAYGLLASLFAEKKREVESRFVGPLTSRVADYLRCLYGPDTTVAVDYRDGGFTDLTVARPDFGNAAFAFGRFSGGGREQVAAAFRLAMAEILATDHDGCLPIVFDDAFVNTDPSRLRGLQGMLDLAADRGLQVIVLSCNHRLYDTLGAATVELPKIELPGMPTVRAAAAAASSAPADDDAAS